MKKYLLPLEQLEALNAELLSIADSLANPVIIVGGQSVSYWYSYYQESIPHFDMIPLASVDIDYIAQKDDISKIVKAWNVDVQMAGIDVGPPSIAIAYLKDKDTQQIKSIEGCNFIDVDEMELGFDEPNLVDFIDAPAGFNIQDVKDVQKRKFLTSLFQFSTAFDIQPNEKILILNPIGCFKSRVGNLFHSPKQQGIELIRIESLKYPLVYFFQDLAAEEPFRKVRKHITVLHKLLLTEDSIRLFTEYDVDYRSVFANIVLKTPGGSEKYYEFDGPNLIRSLNKKYEQRKKVKKAFLNRNR
ncbi:MULTISPECIES: hypothetical protein [Shewanella]|uniref:Nucleotidyltransferase family protein n=1 Tax=Shewanella polaris TaxID=2588449 RepID=A0A4Y5YJ48_9GAMM|nr:MULTISPECIES: hypothetical protein [Shewanella]QDE32754.1 hypothetical protein FH971_18375 [Shewanella polaris]